MDRQAAIPRLRHLAQAGGVRIARTQPHMVRHMFMTTMLDAGVDLRDVQIAARHADPRTTMRYDPCTPESRPPRQLHPAAYTTRHLTSPNTD
jgi:site-specific recombinase XerD